MVRRSLELLFYGLVVTCVEFQSEEPNQIVTECNAQPIKEVLLCSLLDECNVSDDVPTEVSALCHHRRRKGDCS